jgi:hypothetical protein
MDSFIRTSGSGGGAGLGTGFGPDCANAMAGVRRTSSNRRGSVRATGLEGGIITSVLRGWFPGTVNDRWTRAQSITDVVGPLERAEEWVSAVQKRRAARRAWL